MSAAPTSATAAPRRPAFGWAWFAAMVAGWIGFFALAALSEETLGALWRWGRDLPLVVEGLVWLLLFPFVLAAGIWESDWQAGVRLALVACCAALWTLVFFPWQRR